MAQRQTESESDRYVTVREWDNTAVAIDSENGDAFIRSSVYADPSEKL